MGPLDDPMADDFFIPNPPLSISGKSRGDPGACPPPPPPPRNA